MIGTLLTHWTIRLALLCYVAYGVGQLASPKWAEGNFARLRVIWTFGCAFFCLHVLSAFAFFHHFSHQAAYETTARQTQEMLGYAFGEGIYFSYLFLLIWIADCIWQWLPGHNRKLPAGIAWGVHAYIFFIAINGALVFEGGVTRWFGIPLTLLLAILVVRRYLIKPACETSDASVSLQEANAP